MITITYIIFFFNDTATTAIYTLSLHDALPICPWWSGWTTTTGPSACACTASNSRASVDRTAFRFPTCARIRCRSEEHTSELQSRLHLVCRLLLEKKKKNRDINKTLIAK